MEIPVNSEELFYRYVLDSLNTGIYGKLRNALKNDVEIKSLFYQTCLEMFKMEVKYDDYKVLLLVYKECFSELIMMLKKLYKYNLGMNEQELYKEVLCNSIFVGDTYKNDNGKFTIKENDLNYLWQKLLKDGNEVSEYIIKEMSE